MRIQKLVPGLLFLLLPFLGMSQIITSKKEAQKKGVYPKQTAAKAIVVARENQNRIAYTDSKPNAIRDRKAASQNIKSKKNIINTADDKDIESSTFDNYIGMQMINNAMGFLGVRYSGGGTTVAGMDCSGMVTAVFNIFEKKLPRSSVEMAKVGEKMDRKDVQIGDLIFFKTNGRSVINHVGMVVEILGDEIKFIHSSSSRGVIISSLNESYYQRAFAQVNRVINQL